MMWAALVAKGTEMLLVALALANRGAPSMATTCEIAVTEFPAGRAVVIIFANTAVVTGKVKIALAITALVADAVAAAGHARAAVFVARACWIEVDCALAAMLLSLEAAMLTREVPTSADTLPSMVALATPVASLRINAVDVACGSEETWLATIAAGASEPKLCSAETCACPAASAASIAGCGGPAVYAAALTKVTIVARALAV